ncbi:MAG TPA: hypothetical protein VIR27_04325, partial [Mycobacteriales bacterium]
MTSQDDIAVLRAMRERGEISDDQYTALRRYALWGTPLPPHLRAHPLAARLAPAPGHPPEYAPDHTPDRYPGPGRDRGHPGESTGGGRPTRQPPPRHPGRPPADRRVADPEISHRRMPDRTPDRTPDRLPDRPADRPADRRVVDRRSVPAVRPAAPGKELELRTLVPAERAPATVRTREATARPARPAGATR